MFIQTPGVTAGWCVTPVFIQENAHILHLDRTNPSKVQTIFECDCPSQNLCPCEGQLHYWYLRASPHTHTHTYIHTSQYFSSPL